jgi:predicted DNA-binding protein
MPTSVRLDIKTEQLLTRLARKKRTTKSVVLREAVAVLARQDEQSHVADTSVFTRVEDLIGCVSGGPDDLSLRTGERFKRLLASGKR